MSFQPVLPFGGYAGWKFLQSSLETQQEQFSAAPAQSRDRDYFRATIGSITSAEELVSDFRLLRVALGAYGLQEDLQNKAFIQKVLSDGVLEDDALSNRLADKRYRAFSEAFGFGSPLPPRTLNPGFADEIMTRFDRQSFEVAVGDRDEDMRLALTAAREVPEIAADGNSNDTSWLSVMGNPPLRKVFETAFGLPASIGTVDLDQQLQAFQEASERLLGSSDFAQFNEPEAVDDLLKSFTLRSQLAAGPSLSTRGASAVVLLQNLV